MHVISNQLKVQPNENEQHKEMGLDSGLEKEGTKYK